MNLNPVVLSIPIYFLLIGVELIIQQFSKKRLYRFNDAVTNISCGITSQLSGIFLKIFGIGIYQYLYEHFALFQIETNAFTLVALFILVDFCYYWAHRMSHEINLFWGAHVVHHQSEDYNFSVALRQSSFQIIWTSMFYFPLAIFGFNTLDFVLMNALTTVYQFWIHTETIGRMGWLEYVLNTPSHHRVHHGRDPKYIDRNHAGVFIVWDKLFGTFQPEEEKPTYGITTPINSWNPVWANFAHYQLMWDDMKKMRIGEKMQYIFRKPGWLPERLGGQRQVRKVDRLSYQKFKTQSPTILNFYVLYQYAIALGGTALFLFNASTFSFNESVLIASLITITVVNCGALFENRSWVLFAEYSRILIYAGGLLYLSYANLWDIPLLAGGLGYLIVSTVWLFSATNKRMAVHA